MVKVLAGSRPPEDIRGEAAAWLARLHSDLRTEVDERAFRKWLEESPDHAAAFDAITRVWDVTGGLAGPTDNSPRKVRRRVVLAGLGTFVVVGGSLALRQRAQAGVYETAIGEQKHVLLTDGSSAFLDSDTHIQELYDAEARTVSLKRGRVDFDVIEEPRPFVVSVAGRRILAARSVFDVGVDGSNVSVVLLSGNGMRFADSGSRGRDLTLDRGQRLQATAGELAIVDRPSLAPLVAWQMGQAIFESEPLGRAIREMNRYSTLHLVIDDPGAARLLVSGVYRVGDNRAFAEALTKLLPVAARIQDNRIRLTSDPARLGGG